MRQIYNISSEQATFRLHLTNVNGLGAVQLIQSLLPSLVCQNDFLVEQIYVSENIDIIDSDLLGLKTKVSVYKRYVPNSLSRLLECTIFGSLFNGNSPLLVLGDIPLKCNAKQVVFLQNALLLDQSTYGNVSGQIKYWILKSIFRNNLKYVSSFIVQTITMKDKLIKLYPEFKGRVFVLAQPVPEWLIKSNIRRSRNNYNQIKGITLFYPAAFYPHKNHHLLSHINNPGVWPIDRLTLTIPDKSNPLRNAKWVCCRGTLSPELVLAEYSITNALLFLSQAESYGFPLIEAMWIGLPIICPDLKYARDLCGDQAIYFSCQSVDSLQAAVAEMNNRLSLGWWPDWTDQLSSVPRDWTTVARRMSEVVVLNN